MSDAADASDDETHDDETHDDATCGRYAYHPLRLATAPVPQ
jgi:hypothetical protein